MGLLSPRRDERAEVVGQDDERFAGGFLTLRSGSADRLQGAIVYQGIDGHVRSTEFPRNLGDCKDGGQMG